MNGEPAGEHVVLRGCTPDSADLEIDGMRRRYQVDRAGAEVYVHGPGTFTTLTEVTRLADPARTVAAGSLLAPMPATVISVTAAAGDTVAAGHPLIVLEAMKMQHPLPAPAGCVVAEMRVKEGEQVAAGQILAVLETSMALPETEPADAR